MRISNLTTPLGDDVLVFRQLEGNEGINTLFNYTLLAHSIQDELAAKSLLGKAVGVSVEDQHGSPVYLNAIVSDFKRLGRDDRHTMYEMKLVPWFWLTTLSADCRIFQNMSVVEIITAVLGKYPFPIDMKLRDNFPPLLFVVQYNESDHDFCCRMMEEHGINYRFAHQADRHTLVLSERAPSFGSVPGHEAIPFRAPGRLGISTEETISKWTPSQTIKSGSFITSDYHYRYPNANLTQRGNGTYPPKQHDFADLPVFHWQGQGHYHERQTGERLVELWQDQQQQEFEAVDADCNVRALALGASGLRFTLSKHPQREFNCEMVIIGTQTFLKENPGSTAAGEHTDWRVSFTGVSSKNQYRPNRVTPLPRVHGPQTAIVVGPAGQEIWTNDLGEVRVRFLWDRYAPGDEGSSCWIRVSSSWAGNGLGEVLLPRIGDEVIVSFLDGNPSHPIITGRVINTTRLPAAFSNSGNLPGNQALAGIKSRELNGVRHNHLLFDDSTGQIRTQIESEHGKTQLNMGYLVHPRDTSAAPRGDGFELRSDHAGALRAAKGLYLTTDRQSAANGTQLERAELTARLERAEAIVKQLSDLSNTHQADDTNQDDIKALVKAIADWDNGSNLAPKANHGGAGTLAATSPAYLTLASDKGTTIATGTNLDLVPTLDCNMSVGRRLAVRAANAISLFSYKIGIKMIAASGDITLQAQKDNISIGAAKQVHVYSAGDEIVVESPKAVTIRADGAEIRIGGGSIEMKCTGTLTQKAANFSLLGAAGANVNPPPMPTSKLKTDEQFVLHYRGSHAPAENRRYEIKLDDGRVIQGVTDAAGKTSVAKGDAMHIADLTIFNE